MSHSFGPEHPFKAATTAEKIFGCIIGSALGDTIGLYTEFLSESRCEIAYPTREFTLLEPRTEPGLPALDRPAFDIGVNVGAVSGSKQFLQDPFKCATGRWIKGGRVAAPNGSLMRTHPVGVIGVNLTEEQTWRLSVDVGRTMHVDPRCVVACCISVGLIRQLLCGQTQTEQDMDAAVERAYKWVRKQYDIMNPDPSAGLTESQIRKHLDRQEFAMHVYAQTLETLQLDDQMKMGYVYKCLGSVILALRLVIRRILRISIAVGMIEEAELFENSIVQLIMEGDDADTNGAATGALLGAYLGYANSPLHWRSGLAHKQRLMTKVERLTVAAGVGHGTLLSERDEAPDGRKKLQKKRI
ncbi:ADP-ribosylglycohydrolase [Didymella exigua CBS 183.55]|uniref:ADP-ribosylglycohydrolase n=1 Tax=Didymella exigua CBS 183.55 TaxID=1150837 RepID=A0A6A5RIK5_9PLEO|nr:ADP-ribosylglycohydrolase [Didymella exigua CBS 183.55]KAF1926928.1 ADP-ribosylglycohydrolase [Didymella exigua CBS 183.55]